MSSSAYSGGALTDDGSLRDGYGLVEAKDTVPYVGGTLDVDGDDEEPDEISADGELTSNVLRDEVVASKTQYSNASAYNAAIKAYNAATSAPAAPAAQLQIHPELLRVFEKKLAKDPSFKFNVADLTFKAELGRGGFGFVTAASFKADGRTVRVAVKSLHTRAAANADNATKFLFLRAQVDFWNEIRLLRRIGKRKPQHVVKLLGVFNKDNALHAVVDFALLGSLEDLVFKDQKSPGATLLTDSQKANLLYQAASGVNELHNASILHCDIAARNFLAYFEPTAMDKGLVVKACDLGLAIKVPKGQPGIQVKTFRFVPARTAPPEAFRNFFTYRSDSYQFAGLMHEVFTATEPHHAIPNAQLTKLQDDIRDGKLKLATPAEVEKAGLGALFSRCANIGNGLPQVTADALKNCINNRPTFKQILQALDKFKNW